MDLEQDVELGRIRIFQRTNPGEGSTRNPFVTFTIKVLDKDGAVVWEAPGTYSQDFANTIDIKIPAKTGRKVRIDATHPRAGARVELAEIEVYPYAKPLVTLEGASVMTLSLNSTFTDPGAKAVDFEGTALQVITEGQVNTATAGKYTITYKATDKNGSVGTIKREVTVQ
jgi:hypothetical protein